MHGWRSLFYFGAAPPVLIIAFRWYLPETNAFQVMKAEREAKLAYEHRGSVSGAGHAKASGFRAWAGESWHAIKENWVLFIYMVLLMSFFNACSHGMSIP